MVFLLMQIYNVEILTSSPYFQYYIMGVRILLQGYFKSSMSVPRFGERSLSRFGLSSPASIFLLIFSSASFSSQSMLSFDTGFDLLLSPFILLNLQQQISYPPADRSNYQKLCQTYLAKHIPFRNMIMVKREEEVPFS